MKYSVQSRRQAQHRPRTVLVQETLGGTQIHNMQTHCPEKTWGDHLAAGDRSTTSQEEGQCQPLTLASFLAVTITMPSRGQKRRKAFYVPNRKNSIWVPIVPKLVLTDFLESSGTSPLVPVPRRDLCRTSVPGSLSHRDAGSSQVRLLGNPQTQAEARTKEKPEQAAQNPGGSTDIPPPRAKRAPGKDRCTVTHARVYLVGTSPERRDQKCGNRWADPAMELANTHPPTLTSKRRAGNEMRYLAQGLGARKAKMQDGEGRERT